MLEHGSKLTQELKWSATLHVSSVVTTRTKCALSGDKILLPPSVLEHLLAAAQITTSLPVTQPFLTDTFGSFNPNTYDIDHLARQPQLPHPLTFRLFNPENGRIVYAGVREFSADDKEIVLSDWVRQALDVKEEHATSHIDENLLSQSLQITQKAQEIQSSPTSPRITIQLRQLPKGTFVKLRPLEAGYDTEDWKALLEQYLRKNFTTLTRHEILHVSRPRGVAGPSNTFKFLIDTVDPEDDAICIIDTDLEVAIEPLNEEQARETVRTITESSLAPLNTNTDSSPGGRIDLYCLEKGHIAQGDWIDYILPSWARSQGIEVVLEPATQDQEIDIFINPLSPRLRVKPRQDEYVFSTISRKYPKTITIGASNTELEEASAIQIAIYAYKNSSSSLQPVSFSLAVHPLGPSTRSSNEPSNGSIVSNGEKCKNCHQLIPEQALMLHENFCYRNNILCPGGCKRVFQKQSPEWQTHWHCVHDDVFGDSVMSKTEHDEHFHVSVICPSCEQAHTSVATLAKHRTTVCPGKLILCQFCHLEVPQEGDPDRPNPEAVLSGLTVHELADGSRTTECHLCSKLVRLRDMRTHLAHHELQKSSRPAPIPCRNVLCGRSVHGTALSAGDTRASVSSLNNEMGLCSRCFGPLFVAVHDPQGKALKRRIERRYLSQLLTGCGKTWCYNQFCKTGRQHLNLPVQGTTTKEALPMTRPELVGLDGMTSALHFCVDDMAQKSRRLAQHIAAQGVYAEDWCIGALEAASGDINLAQEWMANWAPKRNG